MSGKDKAMTIVGVCVGLVIFLLLANVLIQFGAEHADEAEKYDNWLGIFFVGAVFIALCSALYGAGYEAGERAERKEHPSTLPRGSE